MVSCFMINQITVVFRPTVQSHITNTKKLLADELQLKIKVHQALRGPKSVNSWSK